MNYRLGPVSRLFQKFIPKNAHQKIKKTPEESASTVKSARARFDRLLQFLSTKNDPTTLLCQMVG
jgi:hypothetical protein